VILICMTFSAT